MSFLQRYKAGIGLGLYAVGIVIGLLFAILVVWADFEAYDFQAGLSVEQKTKGFSCPLAITSNESGLMTAEISNNSTRDANATVRMMHTLGSALVVNQVEQRLTFSPGQTHKLSWPIQASDAAWDRFIMARIYVVGSMPPRSTADYCGILLINSPFFTGQQILVFTLALALVFVVVGWRMWFVSNKQPAIDAEKSSRLMIAFAALVALNIFLSINAEWLASGPLLIVNLLLAVAVLANRLNKSTFS